MQSHEAPVLVRFACKLPARNVPRRLLDVATALRLLGMVVQQYGVDFAHRRVATGEECPRTGRYACNDAPDCIVGHALAYAGVSIETLEALSSDSVDDLYASGHFPVSATLGAIVVLRAAQRTQDRGGRWGDALASATEAAARLLDLLPDNILDLADA